MSDMHLDPTRPEISTLFVQTLEQHAGKADAVYLLGDLFEVWLGDTVSLPDYPDIVGAMRQLVNAGTALFVMRGNRDFMLSQGFAEATGATLLADTVVVDLYGTKTLISHGDQLCTDDVSYQRFRKVVTRPWVQWLALHCIPDSKKRRIAADIRAASKKAQTQKQADIMDVNNQAVTAWFERYGVSEMIHGHTHRPKQHQHTVNGQTATRWVLGDWYSQGSLLTVHKNGEKTLQALPLAD